MWDSIQAFKSSPMLYMMRYAFHYSLREIYCPTLETRHGRRALKERAACATESLCRQREGVIDSRWKTSVVVGMVAVAGQVLPAER